ncbi:MAG: glycosyltransferase [Alphaproteobacteria bacterium]|nr:glycosyltransferase [Alphaproteobacteria bacterium]
MTGLAGLPGRAARFAARRVRRAWRDAGLGAGLSRSAARRLIAGSGVFDEAWYRERYGDLGRWRADAIGHYLDRGIALGHDPSVLFWTDWYAARHPGCRDFGGGPLVHYLMGKGSGPNPLFDDTHYRTKAGELNGAAPLAHYIAHPAGDPHPLFDTAWYLERYAAAIPPGITPLAHFLMHGAGGTLNPGPHFDADVYLARYPDVAATGQNPLVHFVLGGAFDLRDPSPRFCTARYLRRTAEARESAVNPLVHAIQHGRAGIDTVEPPPLPATDPRPELKVTAVIPNYNHAPFLPQRFESILAQTAPPAEIVFLDDASSDDSLAVAERYAARSPIPIRIVHNSRRSGSAFRQWAKGLGFAATDLVWFAESDDRCAPELLAALKAPFTPDVHLSYAQSRTISASGLVLAQDYRDYTDDLSLDRWRAPYVADGRDEVIAALAHKNTIPNGSAALLRRATVQPLAEALTSFRQCGDWFVYLACAAAGRIAFTPAVLNDHRRHGGSATRVMGSELDLLDEAFRIRLDTIDRFDLPDTTVLASLGGLAAEYFERTGGCPEGTPPLKTLDRFQPYLAVIRDEVLRRFGSLPPLLHIANGPGDWPPPDTAGFLAMARPPVEEPAWAVDVAPSVWIEGRAAVTAWSAPALWRGNGALNPRRIATLAGLAGLLNVKSVTASGGEALQLARHVAAQAGLPLPS